jgi:hydrogenase expression/formation protein HypC
MCLAVPAKIVELQGTDAVVEIEGVRRKANVFFIEEPKVGDYVVLHAGFAIRKWTEDDVAEYRRIVSAMLDAAEGRRSGGAPWISEGA